MDCLFCEIANKNIPSDIIYEDEQIIAFSDINPRAPIHKLIIPRKHIATINDIGPDDSQLLGDMLQVAKNLAAKLDIAEDGYRLVYNVNRNAGQEVFHIHLHLLGGRSLTWPPG